MNMEQMIYGTMIIACFLFGLSKGCFMLKNSNENFSKTDNPILYFLGMDN